MINAGYANKAGEAEPQRQTQLSREFDVMSKEVGELQAVIERLESRLNPILMPPAPTPPTGAEKPLRTVRVAMAEQLDTMSDLIAGSRRRLKDIIDRCEL